MNVKNEKDKEEYKNKFFSEEGYNILMNYLKGLIIEYMNREEYPYNLNPVLGIPLFQYSTIIKSSEEMLGRIKILGQILGVDNISFEKDNKKIKFNMDGEFIIS